MRLYRLLLRHLRTQKRRTILTIVSVALSIALITAAGILGQSIRNLGIAQVQAQSGSYYATYLGVDRGTAEAIDSHALSDEVGRNTIVGSFAVDDEYAIVVQAPDEHWMTANGFGVTTGRLPNAPGEIAVEPWVYDAAGIGITLGDEIEARIALPSRDEHVERFTVVGLLASRSATIAEGRAEAVVHHKQARDILGDSTRYQVGVTTVPGMEPTVAVTRIAESVEIPEETVQVNTGLLSVLGAGEGPLTDAVRTIEIIVTLILMLATVGVVYNIFSISVAERLQQFGILRTIGATPRQIRRLVYREAGVVAGIGAPLGVVAALVAVRAVVALFDAFGGEAGLAGIGMSYPPIALIGGPLVGITTVFLSALAPAAAGGRIGPLEAIAPRGRFVADRVKARRSPILSAVFGVPGRLASQNLRRYRRRVVVTVLSFSIGIMLFVTFTGFFRTLNLSVQSYQDAPLRGDISAFSLTYERSSAHRPVFATRRRDALAQLAGVADVSGLFEAPAFAVADTAATDGPATDEVSTDFGVPPEVADQIRERLGHDGVVVRLSLLGLDRELHKRVRSRILEGIAEYDSLAETGGVYVPRGFAEVGESLSLVVDERSIELPIVGLGRELPGGNENDVAVIAAIDTVREVAGREGYTGLEITTAAGADRQLLRRTVAAAIGGEQRGTVVTTNDREAQQQSITLQMSILLYGLVAVVGVIGALNIINTMTTGLILRTREFGTLRAVGMSAGQMRAVVRIEAVIYGLAATLVGGSIGAAATRLIYNNASSVQEIPWAFPWVSLLASAATAIGIALLAALPPTRRITEMSIVESIRGPE